MPKFKVRGGKHHERVQTGEDAQGNPVWEMRHYERGEVVETETDLAAIDKLKFERVGDGEKAKYPASRRGIDGKQRTAEHHEAFGRQVEAKRADRERLRGRPQPARQQAPPPPDDDDADADDNGDDDLEQMTVQELREYATQKGISLHGASRKDEVIDHIRAAEGG